MHSAVNSAKCILISLRYEMFYCAQSWWDRLNPNALLNYLAQIYCLWTLATQFEFFINVGTFSTILRYL
jgi:hypothetical protein